MSGSLEAPPPAAKPRIHLPTKPEPDAPVACAGCGKPVDALRAARVACFDDRFYFFCSARCREGFVPGRPPVRARAPRSASQGLNPADVVSATSLEELARSTADNQQARALADVATGELGELSRLRLDSPSPAPAGSAPATDQEDGSYPEAAPGPLLQAPTPLDLRTMLVAVAGVGALLSLLLGMIGASQVVVMARAALVLVGMASLLAHACTPPRVPTELAAGAVLAGPLLATLACLYAYLEAPARLASQVDFAAVVVATTTAGLWLVRRARDPVEGERAWLAHHLTGSARRVVGAEVTLVPAASLRSGEELLLEDGDVVPSDATITAGTATVQPWPNARLALERRESDALVAGATVLRGRVRAISGWTGHDRAWARLTLDPRRRADLAGPAARAGRHLAERGAVVGAAIAALAAYSSTQEPLVIATFAAAAVTALAEPVLAEIAALQLMKTVLAALGRGIVFRTAELLDRAGTVSTAAFCARGTLLLGEPEVASVEAVGRHDAGRLLALAAGTAITSTQPTAEAIRRAARDRGVRPDAVRSPNVLPGLGVTATASSGEPLVVGSRALMLEERVGVAIAEARITDLEAMGRSALLIALGGKLIGIIALQDGLEPGARGAVQHLLDSGIEPVLLSGDSRETCEALGRAVDIEHIRPELLPTEREAEVRHLAGGGATVAVLGRSPTDDVPLGAADVSVALGAAGSSTAEWSVQLASNDVRDAAYALKLARRCRTEVRTLLALAATPAIGGAIGMSVGVVPPLLVPPLALAGAIMASVRFRTQV